MTTAYRSALPGSPAYVGYNGAWRPATANDAGNRGITWSIWLVPVTPETVS